MIRRMLYIVLSLVLVLAACGQATTQTPVPATAVIEPAPVPNICGETEVVPAGRSEQTYLPTNSGLKSKIIRSLNMGKNGLAQGYADGVGLGFYDGTYWRFCRETPHVNAIVIGPDGSLWVGTDAPPGGPALLRWDGTKWTDYTSFLPDYRVYDLVFHDNNLYVATWRGVAEYDGREWTVPYKSQLNIFDDRTAALLFAKNGDIWFGSLGGLSTWMHQGVWRPLATPMMNSSSALIELTTNQIRQITENPNQPEIWIAGDGGDVVVYNYELDQWRQIVVPDIHITCLKFDHFDRPWICTPTGTYYLDGSWVRISDFPALAIAFGCEGCRFGPNDVFIATNGFGLVRTNVPPQLTK